MAHTRRTSEWVHELIPGSILAEPPWGDQEWNYVSTFPNDIAARRGRSTLAADRAAGARISERVTAMDAELERKLRELVDRNEIWRAISVMPGALTGSISSLPAAVIGTMR